MGGTGDSATPLYPLFVSAAKELNPEYISYIIPSRWMQGGKSLTKFRADMIADTHIRKMVDFVDSKECFPNVNLDGGVCYFIRDAKYDGPAEYVYKPKNEKAILSTRYLKNDVTDDVIRDYRRISIIEKARKNKFEVFSNSVSSRKPYGIEGIFNNPDKYEDLNLTFVKRNNTLKIWGVKGKKGGAKRTFGYVNADGIEKNLESIDKYKLFFSKAYSTGATVPPKIIVGEPGVICTETFLEIGPFNSSLENNNCLKYIKTKFFRALLFFKRINLNNSKGIFEYIPLQDFTEDSDIDWTQSIHGIDQQLYEKYELSADEIQYIEENIKEME